MEKHWLLDLDQRVGVHRRAGDGVTRATIKAIKEMRHDRRKSERDRG